MEWVDSIPYGLALCRLDGVQVSVTAMGLSGLKLRSYHALPGETLELQLLSLRRGTYDRAETEGWRIMYRQKAERGYETVVSVENAAFRRDVARALREYGELIRQKGELDEAGLAEVRLGCPSDGYISESLQAQKKSWFRDGMETLPPGSWETALSLDRPARYTDYLAMPRPEFQTHFLADNGLSAHRLFRMPARRLYVGNAWCGELSPDRDLLQRICRKAADEGMEVTLVLSAVGAADGRKAEGFPGEIVVNDWGSLYALRGHRLVLGTMLNRRRKDPRMQWQKDMSQMPAVRENDLNDSVFLTWLGQMGVERLEYESCGYIARTAPAKCSLHLPFYQTNTSHDCVLSSVCRGLDPGVSHGKCSRECERHALLYPDEMNLAGRYNSIFGRDPDILTKREALSAWLDQGIDRLVVEGL